MQETLYKTVDAGNTQSESGSRSLSIRQQMLETLFTRQWMQKTLSDSGWRLSIRQRMQETLYQTADAGDSL